MKTGVVDLQEFLRSRRSVRRFLPQPVPQDVLERILETATWAPSAHNRQPWRLAVIISTEMKAQLAESMGTEFRQDLLNDGMPAAEVEANVSRSKSRLLEAPVVIILCSDVSEMDTYPDEKRSRAEVIMAVQSVAMAGGTLLQAAHAEGLGGVWVCAPLFAPQAARLALDLPSPWDPQGMLLIGYPAKIPEARPRKPLRDVTKFY